MRALGLLLGAWTTVRVVALWPDGTAAELPSMDAARAAPGTPIVAVPLDDDVSLFANRPLSKGGMHILRQMRGAAAVRQMVERAVASQQQTQSVASELLLTTERPGEISDAIVPGLPTAAPTTTAHNRLSGSAWALMRGNGAPSLASGGQFGGSQIGMRMFYTPGPEILAITARISAPLSQPVGREAAVGVALRGRNLGIIAEQRVALDKGGRDAPAVFAYGGVYDVKLPGALKLDGYAQAGVVGVKSPAAFVDGGISVARTVLRADKVTLSAGAGLWGGAQPGVSRIDIGPQVVARIAVAENSLRVSAEWRQRVAGSAGPASGPSVTVGFDF